MPTDIANVPPTTAAYYAAAASAFTGVTDPNLAFFGDDFFTRIVLWTAASSGTGSIGAGSSAVDGAGILRCVGPDAGVTGYSYITSTGGALRLTANLRTKKWFLVSRFANTSGAACIAGTRINCALYNGNLTGFGMAGNLSTTKLAFFQNVGGGSYDGTVLSTIDQPALGTYVWGWMGNDGTNIKGSFANTLGVHELPVQVDLASNVPSAGGNFQLGNLPRNGLATCVNKEQADFDLIWFWCER